MSRNFLKNPIPLKLKISSSFFSFPTYMIFIYNLDGFVSSRHFPWPMNSTGTVGTVLLEDKRQLKRCVM